MHNVDVRGQIICPVCDHTVRCYEDGGGRIVWCHWCGTVATMHASKALPNNLEVAKALMESARHQLLARALLRHSRELQAENARLRALLKPFDLREAD